MKHFFYKFLLLFFILSATTVMSQEKDYYYFKFEIKSQEELHQLTKMMSIDKVVGKQVWAYANQREMQNFLTTGYSFELVQEPRLDSKAYTMATTIDQMSNWDRYPTYEVYEQMMSKFANDYPSICKLEIIGTLSSGRKLLALKISDNVNSDNEAEPELLYTSTMHGDEATGYIMLLRLADYLLSNYGNNSYPDVNNLVNNTEIWLNPAANPDGTYHGGNSTVSGSQRYNANNVDLNRNYPDPQDGDHPDGESWQPETQAFMAFAANHHFSLAANFHGGTEVVNYPWDTWSKLSADDAWWQYVSHQFADEAQTDANNNGYMSGYNDGITNGYAWYEVDGGRQDYMNYWHHCREVTIEISDTKLISSDMLPAHWTYLRDALVNYFKEGLNGVKGTVKDGSGNLLAAKVEVVGHEMDNSWVETDPRAGDYYRYLKSGTYSLKFSSEGQVDKIVDNVVVVDGQPTILNVVMAAPEPELSYSPSSISTQVVLGDSKTETITLSNVGGADLNYSISVQDATSKTWISLNRSSGIIPAGTSHTINVNLNTIDLAENTYSCNVIVSGDGSATIPVSMVVYTRPLMVLNKTSFESQLLTNETGTDTLVISNTGNADLDYTINVKNADQNPWLSLNNDGGTITPGNKSSICLSYFPSEGGVGNHSTSLIIGGDFARSLSVKLNVDTVPLIRLGSDSLSFTKLIGQSEAYDLSIKNIGGGVLNYSAEIINAENYSWISVINPEGSLNKGVTGTLKLDVDATGLIKDIYTAYLKVTSPTHEVIIPISLTVDNLPEFYIAEELMEMELYQGSISKDTITIANTGGSQLSYTASVVYTDGQNWLSLPSTSGSLSSMETINFIATFDARNLSPGLYRANIHFEGSVTYDEPVEFTVVALPKLSVNVLSLAKSLVVETTATDTLLLSNIGGGVLDYTASVNLNGNAWAVLNKTGGAIKSGDTDTLLIVFNANDLNPDSYSGSIVIVSTGVKTIPISLNVLAAPQLTVDKTELNFDLEQEEEQPGNFSISNIGGSKMEYTIEFDQVSMPWLTVQSPLSGSLVAGQKINVSLNVSTSGLAIGQYNGNIKIKAGSQDADLIVNLNVYTSIGQNDILSVFANPNPFTSHISFTGSLVSGNKCQLVIFNAIGLEVYRAQSVSPNQDYHFEWFGQNSQGNIVPTGIYLYQIVGGNQTITGKLIKQ